MMVIKVKEDMIGWELAGDALSMMRTANGRRPPCLSDEKVGIIGDGLIGKSLARLCGGLNMTVMIAGKKSGERLRTPFRTPFDVVMRTATVLFICCAANRLSPSLIDADEFSVMRREAIIVNVSRASVVNTEELIKALREDRISGAATDVFDREPVSNTRHSLMVELHSEKLNLIISPHVGHYSTGTLAEQRKMVNERIQYFVRGDVGEVEEAEVTDYDEGLSGITARVIVNPTRGPARRPQPAVGVVDTRDRPGVIFGESDRLDRGWTDTSTGIRLLACAGMERIMCPEWCYLVELNNQVVDEGNECGSVSVLYVGSCHDGHWMFAGHSASYMMCSVDYVVEQSQGVIRPLDRQGTVRVESGQRGQKVPDWALPGLPILRQASYDGSKISPQMGLSGGHRLLRNGNCSDADWWDGSPSYPFSKW
ncbi:hypothetical protein NPX13_g2999 [Xylaria arbuscula]|uniref:D-isomer specific 2-hydroxyacid dehydrogenase NAD-binding domain-containing protein n=1 Tax=Xylaria arbuscula TaxID=114810 RepID=A0A9W8NIR2_9PEZI|nr:hypothetical protein NPX13_g2999 [Xylaria arbuscula]